MRSQLFPSNTTVITWNCLPTSVVTAPFHFHYSRYSFTPKNLAPFSLQIPQIKPSLNRNIFTVSISHLHLHYARFSLNQIQESQLMLTKPCDVRLCATEGTDRVT